MYTYVYICTVHNVRRRAKNTLRSFFIISITNSMKMSAAVMCVLAVLGNTFVRKIPSHITSVCVGSKDKRIGR